MFAFCFARKILTFRQLRHHLIFGNYFILTEECQIKLFLDSLLRFSIAKPDSLTPYTQQMADEMDELLAGVVLDEDE
jgi:hypothetical protein